MCGAAPPKAIGTSATSARGVTPPSASRHSTTPSRTTQAPRAVTPAGGAATAAGSSRAERRRERHERRVLGVEHQRAAEDEGPRRHRLHRAQRFECRDAVLAEVVGLQVGDDGDVGTARREPAPQDAAPRRLEHRRLHARVAQHRARAGGSRPVTLGDDVLADLHAGGAAPAGHAAGSAPHGREQADGGRLAVAAGDERDGDVVQRGPREVGRRGQVGPCVRACAVARADGARVVVVRHRQAATGRLGQHGGKVASRRDLGLGDRTDACHGGDGIELGPLADIGLGPRPRELAAFGGSHEPVRRRAGEAARLVGLPPDDDLGLGPAESRRELAHAGAPGVEQRRGLRSVGGEDDVEHRAFDGGVEMRSHEPPRVGDARRRKLGDGVRRRRPGHAGGTHVSRSPRGRR